MDEISLSQEKGTGDRAAEHLLELRGMRAKIIRELRLLNKETAANALDAYIAALGGTDGVPVPATAPYLHNLAISLMEYAAEQGFGVDFETIGRLCAESGPAEARGRFSAYISELIDSGEMLSDVAARRAAMAVEYLNDHYTHPNLSVRQMTAMLSVSRSHFSAIFKSYTGATFTEFLTRLRMNKACELLLSTDSKNYEVAAAVGYDDPGYFRSLFKRHTGMSPSEYRKNSSRTKAPPP